MHLLKRAPCVPPNVYFVHKISEVGSFVSTDGRSVNPSLAHSRCAGGPTTAGHFEGISAKRSDFRPSPEPLLTRHHVLSACLYGSKDSWLANSFKRIGKHVRTYL